MTSAGRFAALRRRRRWFHPRGWALLPKGWALTSLNLVSRVARALAQGNMDPCRAAELSHGAATCGDAMGLERQLEAAMTGRPGVQPAQRHAGGPTSGKSENPGGSPASLTSTMQGQKDEGPSLPALPASAALLYGQGCPPYFGFLKKDLEPWFKSGITRPHLDSAQQDDFNFLVVIASGELFFKQFKFCWRNRVPFGLLGFLNLIQRYGSQVPDVAIRFSCEDMPVVPVGKRAPGEDSPPITVGYCSSKEYADLVWPDWSFWGWPQTHAGTWEYEQSVIAGNASLIPWERRLPRAYWRGTTTTNVMVRREVFKCSEDLQWHLDLVDKGGHQAGALPLEEQCKHRVALHMDGHGWAVGLKYRLACASTPVFIQPKWHDFYSRALQNGTHFVQVAGPQQANVCRRLNDTVTRANESPETAKAMGQAAQDFVLNELRMDYVYDYMLMFTQEYAKLQRFGPKELVAGLERVTKDSVAQMWPEVRPFPHDPGANKTPCFAAG